jgi:hypothetical protein
MVHDIVRKSILLNFVYRLDISRISLLGIRALFSPQVKWEEYLIWQIPSNGYYVYLSESVELCYTKLSITIPE